MISLQLTEVVVLMFFRFLFPAPQEVDKNAERKVEYVHLQQSKGAQNPISKNVFTNFVDQMPKVEALKVKMFKELSVFKRMEPREARGTGGS